MRKIVFLLMVIQINIILYSQNDFTIKINEASINNMLSALVEARGFNYGEFYGYVYHSRFVNVDGATADILTGNLVLVDVNIVGNINIDYIGFIPVVTHLNGSVLFEVSIEGSVEDGWNFVLTPISNTLGDWGSGIPTLRLNLGTCLLPGSLTNLFTPESPSLFTTDSEIILGYDFIGPKQIWVENNFDGNDEVGYIYSFENVNGNLAWVEKDSPHDFYWEKNSSHQIKTMDGIYGFDNYNWKLYNWNEQNSSINTSLTSIADKDKHEIAYWGIVQPLTLLTNLPEGGSGDGRLIYRNQEVNTPF